KGTLLDNLHTEIGEGIYEENQTRGDKQLRTVFEIEHRHDGDSTRQKLNHQEFIGVVDDKSNDGNGDYVGEQGSAMIEKGTYNQGDHAIGKQVYADVLYVVYRFCRQGKNDDEHQQKGDFYIGFYNGRIEDVQVTEQG